MLIDIFEYGVLIPLGIKTRLLSNLCLTVRGHPSSHERIRKGLRIYHEINL